MPRTVKLLPLLLLASLVAVPAGADEDEPELSFQLEAIVRAEDRPETLSADASTCNEIHRVTGEFDGTVYVEGELGLPQAASQAMPVSGGISWTAQVESCDAGNQHREGTVTSFGITQGLQGNFSVDPATASGSYSRDGSQGAGSTFELRVVALCSLGEAESACVLNFRGTWAATQNLDGYVEQAALVGQLGATEEDPPESYPVECPVPDGRDAVCGPFSAAQEELYAALDNHDAVEYAGEYGVTLQEADARLELQDQAGDLEAALVENEADSFAGLWLEHRPTFRVVVAFTTPVTLGAPLLDQYVAGTDIEGYTVVRQASLSLAELDGAGDLVLDTAPDVLFDMGSDIPNGRIEVYTDSSEAYSAFTDPSYDLPPVVDVVPVDHLSQPEAAGIALSGPEPCTSGFSVKRVGGSTKGILTAGHCDNPLSYQGTHFPQKDRHYGGKRDVKWLRTPGFKDKPKIYDGKWDESTPYYRWVKNKRGRGNQAEGSWVCKFGRSTGYGCGKLVDKRYRPGYLPNGRRTFMLVNRSGVDLTRGGDSGGPWFKKRVAYGIHVASGNDPNYHQAVYMAINFANALDVEVRLKG